MVTVAVTLPEEMLSFVESQAAERGLAGPGEYLRALVAAAQQEQQLTELEGRFAVAVRAIQRGEPNPLSPEDWRLLHRRALSRQAPAK